MYGFFKRKCLGLQKILPPTQSPLGFAARNYGDLSSWNRNPGLEAGEGGGQALVWGWNSLLPRYHSQIFIHHTWIWNQPVHAFTPPASLDGYHLFNSIVVRLPFNSISAGSE